MIKSIEEKAIKIKLFHDGIEELNDIDAPGIFNAVFQKKKHEEHLEVIEDIEKLKEIIKHLHYEIADVIITNRDKLTFDFRVEYAKALTKYGIFEIMHSLICENKIIDSCIEKTEITKAKLLSGFYEQNRGGKNV